MNSYVLKDTLPHKTAKSFITTVHLKLLVQYAQLIIVNINTGYSYQNNSVTWRQPKREWQNKTNKQQSTLYNY